MPLCVTFAIGLTTLVAHYRPRLMHAIVQHINSAMSHYFTRQAHGCHCT